MWVHRKKLLGPAGFTPIWRPYRAKMCFFGHHHHNQHLCCRHHHWIGDLGIGGDLGGLGIGSPLGGIWGDVVPRSVLGRFGPDQISPGPTEAPNLRKSPPPKVPQIPPIPNPQITKVHTRATHSRRNKIAHNWQRISLLWWWLCCGGGGCRNPPARPPLCGVDEATLR